MPIRLHHFFVLTDKPDDLAAEISEIGLTEGNPNTHPGQGTANRRFFLPGTVFEILYVRDAAEATHGPAAGLRFCDRIDQPLASPFGLIVESESEPFPGWPYYPEYSSHEWFFHVGENSAILEEPLCIVMPRQLERPDIPTSQRNPDWEMTELILRLPISRPSPTLESVSQCEGVRLCLGEPFRMEIIFNDQEQGQIRQLMPDFPLTIRW